MPAGSGRAPPDVAHAFLRAVSPFLATSLRHTALSTASQRNEVMADLSRCFGPSGGEKCGENSSTTLATTRGRGYCVNPLSALDRYLSWMSPTLCCRIVLGLETLWRTALDQIETFQSSPGSRACCFSTCSGSLTRQGRTPTRDLTQAPVLPSHLAYVVGALKNNFRNSIARPPMPLSTLRTSPRDAIRKTRGQGGSLPASL